jgi:hypothetical protein
MALERAQLRRAVGGPRGLFGPAQALVLLRAAWPAAVGKDVARRTEVVSLERGVLRIRVPDAGWRKVLHRMRGPILARLGAVAGDLAPRQLGFLEVDPRTTSSPPEIPLAAQARANAIDTAALGASAKDLAPNIVEAAQAISDPDLRARFLASAALYLKRT